MTDPRLCRVCGGVVRTAMGGRYPVHAWYLPEGVPPHRAYPRDVPVLPPPDMSLIDTLGEGADPDRPVRIKP